MNGIRSNRTRKKESAVETFYLFSANLINNFTICVLDGNPLTLILFQLWQHAQTGMLI